MSKRTPGPWFVHQGPRNALPHIRSATGLYVMDAAPRGSSARSTTRQMADAVLIAQAPTLLESLQTLVSLCERAELPSESVLHAARSIIAKATGEEA